MRFENIPWNNTLKSHHLEKKFTLFKYKLIYLLNCLLTEVNDIYYSIMNNGGWLYFIRRLRFKDTVLIFICITTSLITCITRNMFLLYSKYKLYCVNYIKGNKRKYLCSTVGMTQKIEFLFKCFSYHDSYGKFFMGFNKTVSEWWR